MPNASLVGRVNPDDFVITERNPQSDKLKVWYVMTFVLDSLSILPNEGVTAGAIETTLQILRYSVSDL